MSEVAGHGTPPAADEADAGPFAPDPPNEGVARRLRELRELVGQDQAQAAAIAGVDRTTWVNWERARRKADCAHLAAWCDAVGATLDWIYRGRIGALMHPDLAVRLSRLHPDAPGAPLSALRPMVLAEAVPPSQTL